MEFALRPGMRLMRRLGVAGKFGLIAVLLLLPLCTSMTASFRDSTGQIAFADREREGLRYVKPLVRLMIELTQTRNLAQHGQDGGDVWVGIVRELDEITAQHGDQLAVRGDWTRLRADVQAVYVDPGTGQEVAERAELASRRVHQLIKKVADSSNLIIDPQLDSHYLVMILTDRLPRLMLAAADAQDLRHQGAGASTEQADALALGVTASDFADAARQLSLDLTTAMTATSWRGLRHQVGAEAWALSTAVTQYSSTLSGSRSGATTLSAADTATLSASSTALAGVLSGALDQLLVQRHERLMADRTSPLWLTLAALGVVFYLLMALFRATTRDVRAVLEDISTVTNGALNQTSALSGSDEFSQMSRAVIYARDQLTGLMGTLKYQATHDELTALANRSLFTEKVEEALAAAGAGTGQPPPGQVAVLLIDLDGFKDINDSFGHDLGDRLLRMVGARIHRSLPRRSVVARLGSDEFAVLIADQRNAGAPQQTVARLEETLAQPVDIDGRRMRVQAGIGLALATPGAGTTAVELVRNADVALSYAKDLGKGRSTVFESSMHDHTRERTELSADLVQAIDRNELTLAYQPLVDLRAGTLYGVEALLRWDHPTRGSISPAVFVPLAEATGLITSIGRWALEQACTQAAQWQHDFPDGYPLVVEVNLATEQLADRDLVSDVLGVIQSTGVDATALVLEITESSLVRDIDTALSRLGQLSALGLKIALDDFGTGYSSLSYLRRLPATVLKIDKSFVRDDTEEGRALLRSIVDLGTSQGMQIVAEGIETAEQAGHMRASGCHLGQGHLWAPALPAEAITELMRRGGRMEGAVVGAGPALPPETSRAVPRQSGPRH
jgi:diguanylate cyclase (GGDEF)-like protein